MLDLGRYTLIPYIYVLKYRWVCINYLGVAN